MRASAGMSSVIDRIAAIFHSWGDTRIMTTAGATIPFGSRIRICGLAMPSLPDEYDIHAHFNTML